MLSHQTADNPALTTSGLRQKKEEALKRAWSQLLLIFIGVLCLMAQPARQKAEDKIEQPARTAREQSMPEGHHNHQAPVLDELMNPETRAKLVADKRESEFNHH